MRTSQFCEPLCLVRLLGVARDAGGSSAAKRAASSWSIDALARRQQIGRVGVELGARVAAEREYQRPLRGSDSAGVDVTPNEAHRRMGLPRTWRCLNQQALLLIFELALLHGADPKGEVWALVVERAGETFGKLFGCVTTRVTTALYAITNRSQATQKPIICSYFYAPEWTRTTTPLTQDKALNLARLPIPPRAQRPASIAPRISSKSSRQCGRGPGCMASRAHLRRLARPPPPRGSIAVGPCIRPQTALLYEHMFVSGLNPANRGVQQIWI